MSRDITFGEFRTRFSTEEICRAELFRLRFPNGFVCPKCGCTEYYPVRGRNAFQCRACRIKRLSRLGRSCIHAPAADSLVLGIYLCATDKRGISAVQLSRTWVSAMSQHGIFCTEFAAMSQIERNTTFGIVEMDDGYVGEQPT